MKVEIRTKQELDLMRQSGLITAKVLKKAIESVKPGLNLWELDKIAEEEILRLNGASSFKTVEGYYWTSCLTINDEVVHGIPRKEVVLNRGDKISIDLGALYMGWHTDTAWTVIVGEKGTDEQQKFLQVGEDTLWKAVKQAKDGNKVGDISATIQENIEGAGYEVVRSLVGHGVGRQPHEDPEIPGVGRRGSGFPLKSGMTIAIEVIYAKGSGEVYQKEDGWTIATEDGSWGGLFEMSVIVGKSGGEVITDWRKI